MNWFFKGVRQGFEDFGFMIANGINYILLSFVYIVAVGPTSIIAKITGNHFLDLGKVKKKTYWKELNLGKEPEENYYRQF